MVGIAQILVEQLVTYRSERDGKVIPPKTVEYKALKKSIKAEGVLDPVIVMVTPKRPSFAETGAQRVAAAKQLKMKTLSAVFYTRDGAEPDFKVEKRLKSMQSVEALFGTMEILVEEEGPPAEGAVALPGPEGAAPRMRVHVVNRKAPIDPLTGKKTTMKELNEKYRVQDPPGLRQIRDYIAAGIAKF
jgi:hypothetical protein